MTVIEAARGATSEEAPPPRLVLCLLFVLAACMPLRDRPAATPQRPTVSSDTFTTAKGTLELEAGVDWDPDDSFDSPLTFKYGATSSTEVFLAGAPYTLVMDPTGDESGIGDLTLGTRHRFLEERGWRPSGALQAQVKLPTADETRGLGSGEVDVKLAGIATKTFGSWGATAYYELGLLGDPNGGVDPGHTGALACGVPLVGGLGVFGELAGVFESDQRDQVFGTAGLAYAPYPALVFDLGGSFGLNDAAPDYKLLAGLTLNLGALGSSAGAPEGAQP